MVHATPLVVSIVACMAPWLLTERRPHLVKAEVFEETALQYGNDLDVARLDPMLPSEPLANWFFSMVGPRVDYLQWTMEDCGTPKDPPPDTPWCVRGQAKWRQGRAVIVVTIDVAVANMGSLLNEPGVFAVTVMTVAKAGASDAESDSIFGISDIKRLGQWKELLENAAVRARATP